MKKILIFVCLLICKSSFGQDPKFSQYFASPLTLNPALTGYFEGKYRAAVNVRQQWANVGDSYNTYSASAEIKLQDEYYYDDIFSIGLSGLFDESFNKVLKSNHYGVSVSYYKYLDADHTFKVGLAPQVTYVTKALDYDALTVASQFENGSFNMALPNYLDLKSDRLSYLDFNVGANLALSTEKFSASAGYAAFHLTRPQQSVLGDIRVKQPLRHTLNLSFRYLSNDLIEFNFGAHYMKQGKSTDNIFGSVIGFKPSYDSKIKLNAGLWYKSNEKMFFPYVGFDISNISMGLNYSVIANKIAHYQPRTFELSLIFRDKDFIKFKNTCKF